MVGGPLRPPGHHGFALYDDVVTIRAWLTAFVVVLSAVVLVPGSSAAADDRALAVQIDRLTPSRLSADATITMSGIVRNTGSTAWEAVQAYLVIPRSPFTEREQIEQAIEDGQSYTGERVVDPGSFDEIGDLAPGASARFQVTVPVAQAGLTGAEGVYPVGVQVLATDDDGERSNSAVARATTFLPWVADPTTPIAAGLVWAFTPTWDVTDTDLAAVASSAESGQLRHYLDAAAGIPREGRTIVLDPSLLDALDELTDPASPPDGVEISAAQAAGVVAWLDDLRELALASTTWVVGYARPDSLAFTRYPEHATQLWKRDDDATTEALTEHALTGSRAEWPTIAGTTLPMLEDLRRRAATPTVVSRQAVPDWEPRLGSVVNLETDHGPLPLVVNGALPDIPGAETPVTLRQRVLTDAALGVLARSADPSSRADALTFVDPSWDPGLDAGAVLTGALTTSGSSGLTRPVTAGDLVRSSPITYTGDVPEQVDTESLSAAHLDRVSALSDRADLFTDLVLDDEKPTFDREIAATLSVRWRAHPAQATREVNAQVASLDRELAGISIESPSTITLSSNKGGFPLTIANDTDHTVRVGLDLVADNPSLDLDDVAPVELTAGERHTVTVEVDLGEQTSSTVTARLASSAGDTFGSPAVFNIRSSNVGLIVWITMAAAGLLVVATWARRFLGRRRRPRDLHE